MNDGYRLLRELGDSAPLRDIRAAFGEMADAVPEFEGLSWAGLGLKGAALESERVGTGT